MIDLVPYLETKFEHVRRTRDDMHFYQDGLAVPFILENPFCALFVDLGFGKTVISLTALIDLLNEMEFERALVLGPLRVISQTWPDEVPIWQHTAVLNTAVIRDEEFKEVVRKAGAEARAPIVAEAREELARRDIDPDLDWKLAREITSEHLKLRADEIKRARYAAARREIREATARNPATIHLVNREQTEQLVYAWGKDWPYDVVIIDESTSFGDHSTARYKALNAVRPYMKRMIQLTATPTAEGYMKLWAMMHLLDGGKRLGKNITHYRNRYFSRGYEGFSWTLRPEADKDITEKISDICLTLKREDYMPDMKKPIFNPRYVDLLPDEMKLYKELEREFAIETPDGTIVESDGAAGLSNKLLQLASGFVYDGDKQTHHIHDHKIEELQSLVDEACGQPLLVVYWFKPSLARLKKAFPNAVSMDKEGKVVRKWNAGKIDMLLVHPASAGHGLNLQYGGRHMVFFDIPWSLELYLQVIGRLDRQGQIDAVVLHHIIARGTIDEYAVECLSRKEDMQAAFFRLLKLARKRRELPVGLDVA